MESWASSTQKTTAGVVSGKRRTRTAALEQPQKPASCNPTVSIAWSRSRRRRVIITAAGRPYAPCLVL